MRIYKSPSIVNPAILLLLFSMLLLSCKEEKTTYSVLYSTDEPFGEIAKTIKHVVELNNENIELELIIGHGSFANLDSLERRKADFSIIENHMPFSEKITSLLPLYPQILHIFYHADTAIVDFDYDKKIYIGTEGSGTHRFMMDLFKFYKLDMHKFIITEDAFDNDVYCGFTDIIKQEHLEGFEGYRLYSFDQLEKFGNGSISEGISLRHPQVKPFIIPEKTYGTLSEHPIMTISTDAVLVSNSEIPDEVTYEITKAVFHYSQEFTAISPLIYQGNFKLSSC